MRPTLANIERRISGLENRQGADDKRAIVLRLAVDPLTLAMIPPARYPDRPLVMLPRKVSPEQWIVMARGKAQ